MGDGGASGLTHDSCFSISGIFWLPPLPLRAEAASGGRPPFGGGRGAGLVLPGFALGADHAVGLGDGGIGAMAPSAPGRRLGGLSGVVMSLLCSSGQHWNIRRTFEDSRERN